MIKEVTGDFFTIVHAHYTFVDLFKNHECRYKGISIIYDRSIDGYSLKYQLEDNNNTLDNDYTESYRDSIFFNQISRASEDRKQETGL